MSTSATSQQCACCGNRAELKTCARCKAAAYCSTSCEKADWKAHKVVCKFSTSLKLSGGDNALLALLEMSPPPTTQPARITVAGSANMQVFNTFETRMAIFSLLSAEDLLKAQRVCRLWYRHVALEGDLQQRLFFAPQESGKQALQAFDGKETFPAFPPRNQRQREHTKSMLASPAFSGGDIKHFVSSKDGELVETTAASLQEEGIKIVLNPFFSQIWPQFPDNMAVTPYTAYNKSIRVSTQQEAADNVKRAYAHKKASWRRMQLTSPPLVQLDMSMWIIKPGAQRP